MERIEVIHWYDHDSWDEKDDFRTARSWLERMGTRMHLMEVGFVLGETDDYVLLASRGQSYDDGTEAYVKVMRILKPLIISRTVLKEE